VGRDDGARALERRDVTSTTARRKLVCFDFVTHFGGGQRYASSLCKRLSEFDDVTILDAYGRSPDYLETLRSANIPVEVLLPDAKYTYIGLRGKPVRRVCRVLQQVPEFLRLRRRLADAIQRIDPDVIWTNGYKALLLLMSVRRVRKYPLAYWAQGWYRREQVQPLGRWSIKRADCVVAVSNPTRLAMMDWGVSEAALRTVFPIVDDGVLADAAKEPSGPLPGGEGAFRVLVPALFARTKGQHAAVEGARLLKERGLDVTVWLAGDVKEGDRSGYDDHIKHLISRYGLDDTVFLLGFRNDVRSLMRLADVVVLPTHTEGFPWVIQEAMTIGRPVISTPVGGVTDLVSDGETGFLMPVDDAEALAGFIERLIGDKRLGGRMGENAQKRMRQCFTWDTQLKLARAALMQASLRKAGQSDDPHTS
jgi:glycosyltransferase involved in cell wall biosynthesis